MATTTTPEKPAIRKNPDYLPNKELLSEIILSKEQDELTRKAQNMFVLLGKKTIKKMRYANAYDESDCMQAGLLMMFGAWRGFDPAKSTNAFAYFTEIFKKGIARGWNELHEHKTGRPRRQPHLSLSGGSDGNSMYNF